MKIDSSLQNSQVNLMSNTTAKKEAKAHNIVPQAPGEEINAAALSAEVTPVLSEQEIQKLKQETFEINKKNYKVMGDTQAAFATTISEFEKFKKAQSVLNPNLNLDTLDLSQEEDGTLILIGGELNGKQREELESAINQNEELKAAYKQVHEGLAQIVQFSGTGREDVKATDFYGSFRLNELTQSFESQFHDDGFGQDYQTLEEKVNSHPWMFAMKMSEAIYPRVNINI
ncbi:hypothetical protein L1286_17215 [Pseudoalteromonas sp. SMS1]|uniref:hypothetical protein n=1 Tax=Pseudoalteromonas sp. SMS1 TaxID=2908894 RepID=UPI001F2E75D2|nr:hypothetical protein [Pseudoalteromonas sp. SMS1]MCF2859226.1 hypothetical protein [Pseudoalteromonas sp. SMS1]